MTIGKLTRMKAELLYRSKSVLSDGAIVEMVIWTLPNPIIGSSHPYKYRLFYGYAGQRVVGYDNERGKGDHKHVEKSEYPYGFLSVEKLISDFMADVQAQRHKR